MSLRFGFAASLVLAVALAGPALGNTPSRTHSARTWTWSFAADTLGLPPPNTATFGGSWEVIIDSTRANLHEAAAPAVDSLSADSASVAAAAAAAAAARASAPRVLRQSEVDDGIRYHFIQFKKPVLEDQAASVRFRILAGDIDPTAGLMFQVDAKGRNGYIVRVSGESNQLIAHYLIYGKRRDLRYAKIEPLEPGAWHTLSVERKGSIMTVSYDGKERMKIRDERYTSGSVGLWTEDDTVVDFEQLAVSKR
ncbi:MAG TPA: hypothetical protein VJQ53_08090 [Candidatus Eisenbacteria bacterium]|nr:hypothetical protein [Candidatus Eisenbacteria bacterium]